MRKRMFSLMLAVIMVMLILPAGTVGAAAITSVAISDVSKSMVGNTLDASFVGAGLEGEYAFTWVSANTFPSQAHIANTTPYSNNLTSEVGTNSYVVKKADMGKAIRVKAAGDTTVYSPQIIVPGNVLYSGFKKNGQSSSNVAVPIVTNPYSGAVSSRLNDSRVSSLTNLPQGTATVPADDATRVIGSGGTTTFEFRFTDPVYINTVKVFQNGTMAANGLAVEVLGSSYETVATATVSGTYNAGAYTMDYTVSRTLAHGIKVSTTSATSGGVPSLYEIAAYDTSTPSIDEAVTITDGDVSVRQNDPWSDPGAVIACPNLGVLAAKTPVITKSTDGGSTYNDAASVDTFAAIGTKYKITYEASEINYYGQLPKKDRIVTIIGDETTAAIDDVSKTMVGDTLTATANAAGKTEDDITYTWVAMDKDFLTYSAGYDNYNTAFEGNSTVLKTGKGAGANAYTVTKAEYGKVIRVKIYDGTSDVWAPQIVVAGNVLYSGYQKIGAAAANITAANTTSGGQSSASTIPLANDGTPDTSGSSATRFQFASEQADAYLQYKFTEPVYIDSVLFDIVGTISSIDVDYMTDAAGTLDDFASTADVGAFGTETFTGVTGTYRLKKSSAVLAYGIKFNVVTPVSAGGPSFVEVAAYDSSAAVADAAVGGVTVTNGDRYLQQRTAWSDPGVVFKCPNLGALTYATSYEVSTDNGANYTAAPGINITASVGTKYKITYTATQKDYYGNYPSASRIVTITGTEIADVSKAMVGDTLTAVANIDGVTGDVLTYTWYAMDKNFLTYNSGYANYNTAFDSNSSELKTGTGAGANTYTVTRADYGKIIRVKASNGGGAAIPSPQIVIGGNVLNSGFKKNGAGAANIIPTNVTNANVRGTSSVNYANDGLSDVNSAETSRTQFFGGQAGAYLQYKFTEPVYIDTVLFVMNGTVIPIKVEYMTNSAGALADFASTADEGAFGSDVYAGTNGGTYRLKKTDGVLAYGIKFNTNTSANVGSPSLVEVAAYDSSAAVTEGGVVVTQGDRDLKKGEVWVDPGVDFKCPNLGTLNYDTTYEVDLAGGTNYVYASSVDSTVAVGAKYKITYTATQKDYYDNYPSASRIVTIVNSGAQSNDPKISAFNGADFSGVSVDSTSTVGTISNVVFGTNAGKLMAAAVTDDASIALQDKDGNDITLAANETYLLGGGEKLYVTAQSGAATKEYAINILKMDITNVKANGAIDGAKVSAYVSGSTETSNNTRAARQAALPNDNNYNNGSNTDAIAYSAFGGNPAYEKNYLMRSVIGAKAGGTGANTDGAIGVVYNDYNNATSVSSYWFNTVNVSENKTYAINFSVLLDNDQAEARVTGRAGNHNAGITTNYFRYDPTTKRYAILGVDAGEIKANVWYNVSIIVETGSGSGNPGYTSGGKRLKGFVNGELVADNMAFTAADNANNSATNLAMDFRYYNKTNTAFSGGFYADNISVYQIGDYDIPFVPNTFDFAAGVSGNADVDNAAGVISLYGYIGDLTAADIVGLITNKPSGYTVTVYNNAETTAISGGERLDWTKYPNEPYKLVLKNGDFVKNYFIMLDESASAEELQVKNPRYFAEVGEEPSIQVQGVADETTYKSFTAEIDVVNNVASSGVQKATALMMLYDVDNNAILNVSNIPSCEIDKTVVGDSGTLAVTLNNITVTEGETELRIFVWDGMDTMIPLNPMLTVGYVDSAADVTALKAKIQSGIFKTVNTATLTTAMTNLNADGSFNKSGVSELLDYSLIDNVTSTLDNIDTMIRAYMTSGSEGYGTSGLKGKIDLALSYFASQNYAVDNWWEQEINAPKKIANIFLYEYPFEAATKTKLLDIAAKAKLKDDLTAPHGVANYNNDRTNVTGANLTDRLLAVYKIAVMENDVSALAYVKKYLDNELDTFDEGKEGIMKDYSFQQHSTLLYGGAYGIEFMKGVNELLENLNGTSFMVSSRAVNAYADFVLDGQQYLFRGGAVDFGSVGRSIANYSTSLSQGFTTNGSFKTNMAKAVNSLLSVESINRRRELNALRSKRLGFADGGLDSARHFWTSDYTVAQRSGYSVSVRGASDRTVKTEYLTPNNKKGYFLADGATTVTKNGNEYKNIFPLWDWNKIPGTTTVQQNGSIPSLNGGSGVGDYQEKGGAAFVGGLSDGKTAVSAITLKNTRTATIIDANKAYFMFNEGFVALGSGIKSTAANASSYGVVTSIEQALSDGGDVVYEGGSIAVDGTPVEDDGGIDWAMNNGIGYIIDRAQDTDSKLYIYNQAQTGNWNTIGGTDASAAGNVFSLYLDHGKNTSATPAKYGYIVLPNAGTSGNLINYMGNPNIVITSNTEAAASAYSKSENALGVVFWAAGTMTAEAAKTGLGSDLTITADKPCVVLIKINGSTWTISASDPSNHSSTLTDLTLTINRTLTGTGASSLGVGSTEVVMSVDASGAKAVLTEQ